MKRLLLAAMLLATVLAAGGARAGAPGTVVGTRHDLSVSGPGPIKATTETRVCIFCHVSHAGAARRPETTAAHLPYTSSTSRIAAGAPSGVSRLCLSCHDGTIAVGETVRGRITMSGPAPGGRIAPGRPSNLGTDLRRTHPVSIPARDSAELRRPPPAGPVRLDGRGELQCTSCHDPHVEFAGAPEGKFLVETARGAALCSACHLDGGASGHLSSARPFGPAQGNAEGWSSVGEAACMACHRTHGADARGRLLARPDGEAEDAMCLRCHDGSVARADVARDFAKPFAHGAGAPGQHDPAEGPENAARRLPETSAAAPRHAACVDCHDPHSAAVQRQAAPLIDGTMAGSWGIDQGGRRVAPAQYQYEVCFKCHGDSANKPRSGSSGLLSTPRRAAGDDNLRRVFDPASPSSHPVVAPGRNPDVPSLKPPLTATSLVYCTDCHGSDAAPGGGARGPHGSVYPHLLELPYSTADRTAESPAAYALCYKCHDRDVLLSPRSAFVPHRSHVVDQQAPCSACHSAHGISAATGTPANNAHLVDFDLGIVQPPPGGQRPYVSNGSRSGSCSLSCHGTTHDATPY